MVKLEAAGWCGVAAILKQGRNRSFKIKPAGTQSANTAYSDLHRAPVRYKKNVLVIKLSIFANYMRQNIKSRDSCGHLHYILMIDCRGLYMQDQSVNLTMNIELV